MKPMLRRKSKGQSLVEFAFVFPMIMLFFFATLDMGYYVYGWSETQFAARRGAEQASILPPREVRSGTEYHNSTDMANDPCLNQIFIEAARSGSFNEETRVRASNILISFHEDADDSALAAAATARVPGKVIQIQVVKRLSPLTPVGDTFVGAAGYTFRSISRRTIVNINAGGANAAFTGCRI